MIDIFMFVVGIAMLVYFGEKVVEYAEKISIRMRLPVLFIGLFVVAIGTDIPEITNSIISSALGHGDINVGNAIGSCLAQITLVPAVLVLFSKNIKVKLGDVIIPGLGVLLSLLIALFVTEDGLITWMDALILVSSFIIIMAFLYKYLDILKYEDHKRATDGVKESTFLLVVLLLISLIGVLVGSYLLVEGIIALSGLLNIPEYVISFFGVGLGTSLPEVAVNIMATRKRKYEIAIGNIIGSNIVDATFALGIGPLIHPITLSAAISSITIIYTIFASTVMLGLIAYRKRIDIMTAVVAVILYAFAYTTVL